MSKNAAAHSRYQRLIADLAQRGEGQMQCRGNSMLPLMTNPSLNHYRKKDTYAPGDVVFCKVNGRYIDAHLIKTVGADGRYMIANRAGRENGWTRTIYGYVVLSLDRHGRINFDRRPKTLPAALL